MTLARPFNSWPIQSCLRVGRMNNCPCRMPTHQRIGVSFLALVIMASAALGQSASEWKKRIESAGAGQVVELPAGEFALGDVTIPAGVHLRGAGYNKTIVNAASFRNGFMVRNSSGSEVSDLAIRNARENAIVLSQASHVTLARIEVAGNLTGLLIDRLVDGRIENLIVAKIARARVWPGARIRS